MNPMKYRINIFRSQNYSWLAIVVAAGLPVTAAPVVQTNETQVVPRSVFNLPTNPREGRDPFFPSSLRPYVTAVAPGAVPTSDLSSLFIQGSSGDPEHRLVIINNVTFGVGDDAEVSTSQGRVRIHCLEITGDMVVIEAGGQRRILHYGETP
jgi:hypothetical protein